MLPLSSPSNQSSKFAARQLEGLLRQPPYLSALSACSTAMLPLSAPASQSSSSAK